MGKGSGNLDAIQIIKIQGGSLDESFLDSGFLLNKKVGMHQPQRVENAKILIANTPMDTDKIKVFGSRVKVDNVSKVAEIELAEKEKMKDKVDLICAHDMNMTEGKVGCMKELGITESFSVKRQVLVQASEAAEMILRVDDILKAAPRQREQDRSH